MENEYRLYEDEIEESIDYMKDEKLDYKLNVIYNSIDDGICKGCSRCCVEAVPASYIEFINIYSFLQEHEEIFNNTIKEIFTYYFTEPVKRRNCPFLSDKGLCKIYEVRPLTCRIFGHLSKDNHEKNYKLISDKNNEIREFFSENYDIVIPDDVVNYKLDYCKNYVTSKLMTLEERDILFSQLINFDSKFLKLELLDEEFFNISLVSWFVYLYFNTKDAGELKVKISKEFLLNGNSDTLNNIIENI